MFHWLTKKYNSGFAQIPVMSLCAYIFIFQKNSKRLFLWQSYKMMSPRTTWLGNAICICLTWERTQKQCKPLDTKHTTYHFQLKSTALFLQHSKLYWKWNEKLLVFQILYIEKWYTVWNIASQVKQQPLPPTLYYNSHQWNIIAGMREVKNEAVD